MNKDRERELARLRQARRRARLKENGKTVTVTLTVEEAEQLKELCTVRRMGRTPYTENEFIQLLILRNWQTWEAQRSTLGKCEHCKKEKSEGGCNGKHKSETYKCWLAIEANQLNL